ncbi:ALKALINE CERAMIDASE-RELATED [Salix koriyanagi]|uniref:ALKALINE CERAMIDASE-RELATED n=1 Tax=Salix koriyanagi TaxID=2511006 RepID=A0A9Q0UEG5_9ROSI|nr:ALKALINE CERAMIDASE-RELATED [Salix koriyanagi]
MTGGSLGIRSGSYGSLDKQLQQQQQNGYGVLSSTPFPMQTNGRTKPAKMCKEKENLFHWVFKFAGRKKVGMMFICVISAVVFVWVLYVGKGEVAQEGGHPPTISLNDTLPLSRIENKTSFFEGIFSNISLPPPPPAYFLGYTLPPGHPCNSFTLPPPPADAKRTGPRPCPVCYLPVEEAIALMPKAPSFSPVIKNLTYIQEDPLSREGEFGGSDFGGYPTLKQRSDSYDIRESMSVHCGFVQGKRPGQNTGFDMDKIDLDAMEQCHGVVVASAIFGAFDDIQQPHNVSEYSKNTICFFMFVDEETEAYLKNNSGLNDRRKVGLWRIVVVHNLPYRDGRRNGKVPKLLLHRMFPNARFSLWIDGKLELVLDPYQILERFLWRENATFAISRHYRRFDVFIEAEANKAAGKYENASIDFQVEFYKKEGLTSYSEAKFPITSDVPEGCVVIREHVPISNLFTCLWFNEVDRFTSRDQISFSTVRDKIHEKTNWTVNMFLDCQRRNFVVQRYHRDVLEQMAHYPPVNPPSPPLLLAPPPPSPPPPVFVDEPPLQTTPDTSDEKMIGGPVRRAPARRGRRSGSRRHRKVAAGGKETDAG